MTGCHVLRWEEFGPPVGRLWKEDAVAQLRLVGTPDEVARVLEAVKATLHVTDVYGPRESRHTPGDVLVRAHVETLRPAEQPRRRPASVHPRSAR